MKRTFGIFLALLVWFALILQLVFSIDLGIARGYGWSYGFWIYVAFFTVTTNLLVAVSLSFASFSPSSRSGRFFRNPNAITGIAASIVLVCITYNVLLAHIWNPHGIGYVADLLLHDVVPLLFVVYWWMSVPIRSIDWKRAARWAIYPVLYFVYAMARGLLTDFYPYSFINVAQLGLFRVLLNAVGVLVAFFVILAVLSVIKRTSMRNFWPNRPLSDT